MVPHDTHNNSAYSSVGSRKEEPAPAEIMGLAPVSGPMCFYNFSVFISGTHANPVKEINNLPWTHMTLGNTSAKADWKDEAMQCKW